MLQFMQRILQYFPSFSYAIPEKNWGPILEQISHMKISVSYIIYDEQLIFLNDCYAIVFEKSHAIYIIWAQYTAQLYSLHEAKIVVRKLRHYITPSELFCHLFFVFLVFPLTIEVFVQQLTVTVVLSSYAFMSVMSCKLFQILIVK